MDLNNARRASSAGYRLPERSNGTRTTTSQAPAERTRWAAGDGAALNPDKRDPVKQRGVEGGGLAREERRPGVGQPRSEEPLPTYVSLFSDRIPNTTNQTFGSRMSTPLGSELVRLDRLLLWQKNHHMRKQDPEMLPC
ncbi:LOW QUALITY PROTEIN: ciliary microtubule inner protein 5 [Stegastes partitus]|uniref:LOW QUALITY PROTEIN: ciliary microtubule inner protein 5 n=1 Tax=Stegastes partitus TaxID=144197 RepID=A0A9Y4NMI4_9TELE|nr:PREDICTED: LOW QUALITY PROTEIN: uncharacterized protein C2orf50 homolog [Stegastes partitus]